MTLAVLAGASLTSAATFAAPIPQEASKENDAAPAKDSSQTIGEENSKETGNAVPGSELQGASGDRPCAQVDSVYAASRASLASRSRMAIIGAVGRLKLEAVRSLDDWQRDLSARKCAPS